MMTVTPPFTPPYMPRHLNIPNSGVGYPLTSAPLPAGTPINFSNPLAANTPSPGSLGGRLAASGNAPAPNPLATQFPNTSGGGGGGGGSLASRGRGLLSSVRSAAPRARVGAPVALASHIVANPLGNLVGGTGEDTPGFQRADVGQFTAGATRGAGLGFGIGGGYGALAGGVLGGLAGAFDVFGEGGALGGLMGDGGDKQEFNPNKLLDSALTYSGLDNDTKASIKSTTRAQLELATTDEEKAAILQQAGGMIQQTTMQQRAAQDQLANSLALQAQAAKIFAPFAESNQRVASMAVDVYGSMKQNLGPELDAVADMFAINTQQQADLMTQGLYTTALAKPRIDAMVAQQQQIDSIAAQIVQQASATAASGGGGGGGVDIEALMASVG